MILIGRVTKDIELKTTPKGTSISTFTLAVNREYKNTEGNYDSDFINCVAYEQRAETISKYVKKGNKLGIIGSINTRTYIRQDGTKAYITEIKVDSFEFLESKKSQSSTVKPEYEEIPLPDGDLPF